MRLISRSEYKRYPPWRLYKEDVAEIVKLLKRHSKEMKAQVGDYLIENAAEINRIPTPPDLVQCDIDANMTKDGDYRHLQLEIRRDEISLYVSDINDPTMAGLMSKVEQIIRKRRQFWVLPSFVNVIPFLLAALPVAYFLLSVPFWFDPKQRFQAVFWQIPSALLTLSLVLWGRRTERGGVCMVDRPSFWRRNKDSVVITFIGGLLFLIASIIATAYMSQGK